METRHSIIVAVYVILEKDGSVFMIRRANTGWQDGLWSLPAGHVEEGESVLSAAIREAKEETGVTIEKSSLKLVQVIHGAKNETDEERLSFFFKTNTWGGVPSLAEPEKSDNARWFRTDSLPEKITEKAKYVLQRMSTPAQYSESSWQ